MTKNIDDLKKHLIVYKHQHKCYSESLKHIRNRIIYLLEETEEPIDWELIQRYTRILRRYKRQIRNINIKINEINLNIDNINQPNNLDNSDSEGDYLPSPDEYFTSIYTFLFN